ncbi:MAG: hypothetical protein WC718_15840 [Phycisphaerales bacterium]|jgi:hypothetical protein
MGEVDQNCISYWFPKLEALGVPVPKTRILRVPEELDDIYAVIDGMPSRAASWVAREVAEAVPEVGGYPAFLRTGHTSGKHDWERTCYLADGEDILSHIRCIIEYGEMAALIGPPVDVWAVREMLPVDPLFHAFYGHMPITREFRCFIRDGALDAIVPYWPPSSIRQPDSDQWAERLRAASMVSGLEPDIILSLLDPIMDAFPGYWSVDVLHTLDVTRPWVITDMALGDDSFRWDGDFEADLADM